MSLYDKILAGFGYVRVPRKKLKITHGKSINKFLDILHRYERVCNDTHSTDAEIKRVDMEMYKFIHRHADKHKLWDENKQIHWKWNDAARCVEIYEGARNQKYTHKIMRVEDAPVQS